MRIAFLLTGFYRSFDRVKYRYEFLANYYRADVFISTWNRDEWASNKDNYTREITKNDFEDFSRHVNVEALDIHDLDQYKINRQSFVSNIRNNDVLKTDARAIEHGIFWANRLRDQWYLVNQGWNRVVHRFNYDIIFRSRLDIEVVNIPLYNAGCIVIPLDIGGWNYTDHMAFGNAASMKKYCCFYNNMQFVYDTYNVDPTHAVDFPKFYLTETEPKIAYLRDERIKYNIIK